MKYVFFVMAVFAAPLLFAETQSEAEENASPAVKELSGMSILGNNEAPKSLVIVPWKSSELGDGVGIQNLLDERATPVDKDVFQRQLDYYDIRVAGAAESIND